MNDVAIAPNGDAYVTDSTRGLIFRIRANALTERRRTIAELRPFVRLSDTEVGSYSNGIVAAGRRYLLVVGTASGVLARVDIETKRVRPVDLGGATIPAGDGMARSGRTLYAVNSVARVTEIGLSRDWLRGSVRRHITSGRLHFPTTVAIAGSSPPGRQFAVRQARRDRRCCRSACRRCRGLRSRCHCRCRGCA